MQHETIRRGEAFRFDEDRVRASEAAGRVVPHPPAPDATAIVSARDLAAQVSDEARQPALASLLTWRPDRRHSLVSRMRQRRGGSQARGPFHRLAGSPAVHQPLGGDPWVSAAYALEQLWTRDPRGSRVRSDSPRIPHGKVTKWQSTYKTPCQGAIIG